MLISPLHVNMEFIPLAQGNTILHAVLRDKFRVHVMSFHHCIKYLDFEQIQYPSQPGDPIIAACTRDFKYRDILTFVHFCRFALWVVFNYNHISDFVHVLSSFVQFHPKPSTTFVPRAIYFVQSLNRSRSVSISYICV